MYYILNKETGLYFGGSGRRKEWRKKPRVYISKGAAKLSMNYPVLMDYQWSLLSDSDKEQRKAIEARDYQRHYPKALVQDNWMEHHAKLTYWNQIRHLPLEDLLPPHLELKEMKYE